MRDLTEILTELCATIENSALQVIMGKDRREHKGIRFNAIAQAAAEIDGRVERLKEMYRRLRIILIDTFEQIEGDEGAGEWEVINKQRSELYLLENANALAEPEAP